MTNSTVSKPLNISLWVAQIILAAMFLMAGIMKSTSPIDQLSLTVTWAKDVPVGLVRFIGVSEFLAGVGLLLPSILRIKPVLTTYAASGLVAIMLLAVIFHITRGETSFIGMNIAFAIIALFIAWGRFRKAPIRERS